MYYLISVSEDGDVSVEEFTKEDLLKCLNYTVLAEGDKIENYQSKLKTGNPCYWRKPNLIIKGEIVVPKELRVLTQVDID